MRTIWTPTERSVRTLNEADDRIEFELRQLYARIRALRVGAGSQPATVEPVYAVSDSNADSGVLANAKLNLGTLKGYPSTAWGFDSNSEVISFGKLGTYLIDAKCSIDDVDQPVSFTLNADGTGIELLPAAPEGAGQIGSTPDGFGDNELHVSVHAVAIVYDLSGDPGYYLENTGTTADFALIVTRCVRISDFASSTSTPEIDAGTDPGPPDPGPPP